MFLADFSDATQKNFFAVFLKKSLKNRKSTEISLFFYQKNFLKKLKKGVDKWNEMVYNNTCRHGAVEKQKFRRRQNDGSLAQLGEHLPYKQRVTGSSPVAPTKLVW